MWEIWANYLFPKALKSGPKSNKLPNLVTLYMRSTKYCLTTVISLPSCIHNFGSNFLGKFSVFVKYLFFHFLSFHQCATLLETIVWGLKHIKLLQNKRKIGVSKFRDFLFCREFDSVANLVNNLRS